MYRRVTWGKLLKAREILVDLLLGSDPFLLEGKIALLLAFECSYCVFIVKALKGYTIECES